MAASVVGVPVPSSRVNPDIQKERNTATFDPLHLTYVLDGGKDRTQRRRYVESLALNDPAFKHKDLSFMDREERYTNSIRKAIHTVRRLRELEITDIQEINWYKGATVDSEVPNLSLHESMFQHTVATQMTKEQKLTWEPLLKNYELLGTYAQTELGHGTFLRGLETTATYDPATQEFVLHSPTLTAMKWWPGNLGKTCTHAVVAAQLISKGKSLGIHMFMVQLRSLEDHMPMPGIELGDIGPKFGYANIDNGFLRFDHVRIPRENMFMKYSQIEPDGSYVAPPAAKLTYGSMILIRAFIIGGMGRTLAKGATISIRYSAVRRQSELMPGAKEPQVLEYQSQQLKLFPNLATAYAFTFLGRQMQDMYARYMSELSSGEYSSLPELHATAAGLKAFTSWVMIAGMEEMRLACGGHGYSSASAFPEIYANQNPAATYEGENTVMMLQTARYLLKCVRNVRAGKGVGGVMSYLAETPQPRSSAANDKDFLCSKMLTEAYKHVARRLVYEAADRVTDSLKKGRAQVIASNENHLHLLRAGQAHCHLYVVDNFFSAVAELAAPDSVKEVLQALASLYAVHGIIQNRGEFLYDGYLTGDQLAMADRQLIALLGTIRPNAVTLVDSFDIHDDILGSILGRYDGNVYENLYKWAKSSPLNDKEVVDAYDLHIKPFLQENIAKSKL
ncbi:peroxisomal acyl-coenzyme A oxidase 1-like isoform X2 [Amphiura filiformis]|uniref:peroxisomal acyl-coenzyme A oxidase 1-like isoform X2 n=1 Tax=Amphiura filiformis TaxID=82378 RepID=UPI003B221230